MWLSGTGETINCNELLERTNIESGLLSIRNLRLTIEVLVIVAVSVYRCMIYDQPRPGGYCFRHDDWQWYPQKYL